jgi:hypothetical protein|tara:strand:+ start:1078 stop:1482 length:405 start_codon:yes stop_codon:yes gene_type:complete
MIDMNEEFEEYNNAMNELETTMNELECLLRYTELNDEFDNTINELENQHLSYQKRLSAMCTFPIDYIGDGLYGVYAKEIQSGKVILLQRDEDVWSLFEYVTTIAGNEAVCELSDTAILLNDLEEMVEENPEDFS